MMIYDVWNYNGEPIAGARIDLLAAAPGGPPGASLGVDKFVVVEGRYTFAGRRKDRLFVEDAPFRNRPDVEVVVVEDYVPGGAWANETHQRNAGGEAFIRLSTSRDDLGIFSDADEVPNRDFLETLHRFTGPGNDVLWYAQDFFYYNFGWRKQQPWPPHGFGATPATARAATTQRLRTYGNKQYVHSGWHASYFETPERISDKIQSFSHTELNVPKFTDAARIRERIASGKDLFDRPGEDCVAVPYTALEALPSVMRTFNNHLTRKQSMG